MGETGSTNADLLAAARQGQESGVVLVADYQRAGRGRRGRSWGATPGSSLLFSVLLRPRLGPHDSHLVTTALALAAVEACDALAGVRPGLKWPNDLVVGDRKLAGVLAESVVVGERLEAVVVGMGLNVLAGAAPPEAAAIAIALEEVCGFALQREALLAAILPGLSRWMDAVPERGGRLALVEAARSESVTVGQMVSVRMADGVVLEGLAEDLDEGGGLVLRGGKRVVVGDVVNLRSD
ncbi:biotin--[acetyl-CoA-carboxylase] ligase [Candidatus Poriferisocius sp.]|uniref:biotin--[acetyl-CoA-carboxylase] ligase n=1 Tax=Candidatus Poriferisocius sp. TaxID=3101276 RepID=UPI003B0281E4